MQKHASKSFAALFVLSASAISAISQAAPPSDILVPGLKLYTESITSTTDGSVYIGSMATGAIFRAVAGARTAEVWIKPGIDGLSGVWGVVADEKARTLWACSNSNPEEPNPQPSALYAFDLSSGAPKGKWRLPTAKAVCNDIAVAADGTAYISDMENMVVLRLRPGAKGLEIWAGNGAFGAAGGMLDGIAVVRDHVLVNTLATSKLFSVPIGADGKAGPVAEVKLDRPLKGPDGQRSVGNAELLLVDAEEGGRLVRISFNGDKLDRGKVTTLKSGFADGPTSVTVVGETAYVIEAQFETADKLPPRPFKAKPVSLTP